MRVVVTLEARQFERLPDGTVWTPSAFAWGFWTRYLGVFDAVRVVARVRHVTWPTTGWHRADGEAVSFAVLPYYVGPLQYVLRRRQVRNSARAAVRRSDAVILRVPSVIGSGVGAKLDRMGRPYGLEVVSDPYDVFAPGSFRHPLRSILRWWSPRALRRRCSVASAVAYVTRDALQRRYPPSQHAFTTHYSDVELRDEDFAQVPRLADVRQDSWTVITVGSLANLNKAPDVLISAVSVSVEEGLDLRLVLVGDGQHRPELEAQAAGLGLGDRVHFTGWLPYGEAVRDQLDAAHLFVLPSRHEGLPRAMVEAMARALPCIGSTVGGIPELLPSEDLVPPGDVAALAEKIREVVTDGERLARMSELNLQQARAYHEKLLAEKRNAFYRYVRERTEEWLMRERVE